MSRLVTKPTKWHVRSAKTQISLGIHPVWSESSLSAWRKLRSLATHWAHSEDSDQTGRMPRLIWVFAWRTCDFVGFVTRQLKFDFSADQWPVNSIWVVIQYGSQLVTSYCCSRVDKVTVRPAKTQIRLGIRPVWSESSLSAWRKLGFLATH